MTYDNIKSHKKLEFHPMYLEKPQGGLIDPTSALSNKG